uniref:Uncharacterized protein MANES_02G002100 n=1 Tax=Rhizophora mucronata TaxID=61149 RepID=A0A2P2KF56_RHIMU
MLTQRLFGQFRKLFPPTKWAAEFNAALTVPFFQWLVGPSEVTQLHLVLLSMNSNWDLKINCSVSLQVSLVISNTRG